MSEKLPVNAALGSETATALATSESLDGKHAPKQIPAMQAYLVSLPNIALSLVRRAPLTFASSVFFPMALQQYHLSRSSPSSRPVVPESPLRW